MVFFSCFSKPNQAGYRTFGKVALVRPYTINTAPAVKAKCPHDPSDAIPSQSDIDAAYAVKVFLDHHPARFVSVPSLARQCGMPESKLKKAFLYAFSVGLDEYRAKLQSK
jgi:hypothetical protein